MIDLDRYFHAQETTRAWRAEWEYAGARMELAHLAERAAKLISQHEPVASLGIDREKLRSALEFLWHGDEKRMLRDHLERSKP